VRGWLLAAFAAFLLLPGIAPADAEVGAVREPAATQHASQEGELLEATQEPAGGHQDAGHTGAEDRHGEHEDPHHEDQGEVSHDGPLLELPNLLHQLEIYFGGPSRREENFFNYLASWSGPFFAIAILLAISALLLRGAAKRRIVPDRFGNAIEYVVEAFYNFVHGILGNHARQFAPFLGTLFLYIWLMNLAGLVPLLKAPTSMFETTLALAIVVFLYVQVTGFRQLGIGGYFYHLVGSPKDIIGWCMVPLMLPLHIIGEIAKPVSLSLRLFGNIMGEDVLIAVFTWLGVMTLAAIGSPIGIPLEFPFIFLGLLLSTIQALVFTLLSAIYFSQMLPHEEGHEC
jgi:F-type H+-transporting ATPase subunit a